MLTDVKDKIQRSVTIGCTKFPPKRHCLSLTWMNNRLPGVRGLKLFMISQKWKEPLLMYYFPEYVIMFRRPKNDFEAH